MPGGRRPSGRLGWVLAILLFLLTAALGLAWWAAPEFLRQQAESRGSELLGREVRLQRVELGLFPLRMQAHGLVLEAQASASSSGASSKGSPAAAPLLRLERLAATVDAWSLWHRAPVVTQLEVEGLQVHVARAEEGDICTMALLLTKGLHRDASGRVLPGPGKAPCAIVHQFDRSPPLVEYYRGLYAGE